MESRIEDIVSATISGESYNKPGESRIENLLIDLKEQINDKVDKVSGKGLSTNDFTTAEKIKLDDLAEIKSIGTGLNLDSSTGELTATGGGGGTSDYTDLINKPQINSVLLSGNKSLSDLGITYESKTAASGGTALSLVTTGEKYAWNNKQSAIDDLSTIRSGAALGATAVQPVTGKGLSTNDYTNTDKENLTTALNKANAAAPQSTTYTKSEVDSALAAKLNKSDVDSTLNSTSINPVQNKVIQAPLARLVDAGAKNLCSVDSVSAPDGIGFTQIYRFNSVIPAGKYTVSFDGTISDSVAFSLVDTNDNRITESQFTFNQLSLPIVREISISVASTGIQFYKNSAISFSNIMICTAEDYAISPEFVPYALSNAELTVKEQTNKNNILSEQAKTTGMTEGGSDYITVGGIRVYVSATAPTGTIPDGSIWIGG